MGRFRMASAAGCAVLALSSFNVAAASAASSGSASSGSNAYGRPGSRDTAHGLVPMTVPAGVTAISAGFEHSLALLDDQTVVSWGSNQMSQLGNGTTTTASVPKAVCAADVTSCPSGSPPSSYLHGVTKIAAGAFFSLAVVDGGRVMAWGRSGDGSQGALGIGRTRGNACNGGCQTVPVAVCAVGVSTCPPGSPPSSFLQGVTAIAAGSFFAFAVLKDTTVVAWGSNTSGQLGNPGVKVRAVQPVAVCAVGVKSCPPGSKPSSFLSGVTAVSAGDSFTLALRNHVALAWGQNRYGQLGVGSVKGPDTCSHFACSKSPIAVTKIKMPVSAVSAGNYHSLAIVDHPLGTPAGVEAWGSNTSGQVGISSTRGNACHGDCQTTPVAVRGQWKGLTAIAGGRSFSLALVGGRVRAWGENLRPGRLGNGNLKGASAPVGVCAIGVKSCPSSSPPGKFLHGVTAISAGGTVSLALLTGAVAVWGSNYRSSLGVGNSKPGGSAFPLRVSGLSGRRP